MPQDSPPQYRVLVEKDVPMTTRDGLTLRADVYRPDAPGRFPVLLSRLPYNKNLRPRPGDIDYFVERGYGVIMQDARGRFSSEGEEYYALIWEMADGYDAVEWAAGLPWADGKVGTTGQSYLGATQYLLTPLVRHTSKQPSRSRQQPISTNAGCTTRVEPSNSAGRFPTPFSWPAIRWNARG
jgi:predicted acyl esterase